MPEVSPKLSQPGAHDPSRPDPVRLAAAADALQQAVADLARTIASGGALRKDDARTRFELALADFSALIDTTAT
jgi:hypothetical protein